MRILITGAAGKLGKKLITELSGAKHQLVLLKRPGENLFESKDEIVFGDILDQLSLEAAVKDVDTIIHLAGLTHSNDDKEYYRVNILGTKNLLISSKAAGVKKFIFVSSRTAGYGGGAYAISKLLAEEEVKKSGLNFVILRLAEVYGKNMNGAIAQLVKIIKKCYFIPIIGRGDYKISPVYIDDVIDGILTILNNKIISRNSYLLAGPEEFTYNELVSKIIKILKLKRIKIYLPVIFVKIFLNFLSILKLNLFVKDQLPRLLVVKSADIGSSIKDLNFRPRNFNKGLSELLNKKNE